MRMFSGGSRLALIVNTRLAAYSGGSRLVYIVRYRCLSNVDVGDMVRVVSTKSVAYG